MITPWPHQILGNEMLRASMRAGHRAPILVVSTGGGKTHTFCGIAQAAAAKGKRVLVLIHRHEIILQTSRKLDEYGLAHGIISPHYKQTNDMVQIASVQTLVRRLKKMRWTPDLIICDEAHLSVAPTYLKIFAAFPNTFIVGATATPARLDRKGLGKHCGGVYDDIVQPVTMRELIDAGILVRLRIYAPSTPDLTGLRHVRGDYDQAQLAALMDKKSLVGDVVSHWQRLAAGRPTIAFCVSIQHAQHVAEQFGAFGIRAKAISGETPMEERLDAIKALGDGRLQVVANCALFVEGLDQPCVSCVILLAPTESLTRYLQSVGRGMRRFPGKTDLVILDHAACCMTHGFPDDTREWSLDGTQGKPKDAEDAVARMKMCQAITDGVGCYAMNPLHRSTCEQCGAPFVAHREPPKQTDGELVEITEAQKEQMRLQAAAKQARQQVGRAGTREQLEKIAAERGYKGRWVEIQLAIKERQGKRIMEQYEGGRQGRFG